MAVIHPNLNAFPNPQGHPSYIGYPRAECWLCLYSMLVEDNGGHGVTSMMQLQSNSGDNFMEKERRLSEMIMQLQMVRQTLLTQQAEQQQSKVGPYSSRYQCSVLKP